VRLAARSVSNWLAMGAFAPLPNLRLGRLLRLPASPRHAALSRDRPFDYRGLRSTRGWGWCYIDEVCWISLIGHSAQWSHTELLLIGARSFNDEGAGHTA
jgi:hypothetical protein